jgi:hypothetical protein
MKKITILLALALVLAIVVPAAAEVEEVTIGGSIHARYQYLTPGYAVPGEFATDVVYWFNDDINDMYWGTQRSRINVDASLTGNVRAFAELQTFDIWGADFFVGEFSELDLFFGETDLDAFGRGASRYGSLAAVGNDEVGMYQAYIEMDEIGDLPLMVRVGRQELVYGREWLIGNNDAGVNFSGLAFDGIKASYETDALKVDAWWTELSNFANPSTALVFGESLEDSIDFVGVYGTYSGIENMALDGYFLWIYDDTNFLGPENDNLFTVGARLAGCWDAPALGLLDYNIEGAYQFGDTAMDGDYSAWAFDALAGYTFDQVQWTPRVELEYAFFSGDDEPFDEDVDTFNRLFSDVHYGELNLGSNLDDLMTNMHIARIGASIAPVQRLTLNADFYYFLLADDEGLVLGQEQEVEQDDDVGMELDLTADYQYTEDLTLRAGWAHFFPGDAIENAFGSDDDVDYVFADANLVF